MDPLSRAIESLGRQRIADACGVKYQAVQKWEAAKRLPRTEFSGETAYARVIEEATDGRLKADELLAWSRKGWNANHAL